MASNHLQHRIKEESKQKIQKNKLQNICLCIAFKKVRSSDSPDIVTMYYILLIATL